ncbi:MAG: KH domain-containing protein [Acidobacteria bacterium]|nr:KH domain-containing protein [Acidobacteriota bacterium]
MREAVEMIVRELVRDADAVEVREIERDPSKVIIEVRVAQEDMGKLIGKQGKTVRALRSLLHAVSLKQGRRYVLDIVEE